MKATSDASMDALLSIENLRTYYYLPQGIVKAVDGVSFNINEGDIIGLVGESGCGKSTTGLSILKLVPKPGRIVGGNIRYKGRDIVAMDPRELREVRWGEISMVFQGAMNSLNPVHRIGDQIIEAITTHKDLEKEGAYQRTAELLSLIGLGGPWIRSYPHELSGGMKQRAVLAMALSCDPRLVICDEPTTALDVMVQAQIILLLKELQKRLGLSVLLISHDISLMAELCEKMILMYAGEIVEVSDTKNFFDNPLHPYSKALIASIPSVIGKSTAPKGLRGQPPSLMNPPRGCKFHPRCDLCIPACLEKKPSLTTKKDGRKVACHLVH
jgi:peptide/nickel transport system ATP-binding protein